MTRFAITGPTDLTTEQERIIADTVLLTLQGDEEATEFTSGCAYGADSVGVAAAERAGVPLIRLTIPTGCGYNEALLFYVCELPYPPETEIVWTPRSASGNEKSSVIYLRRNDLTISHCDVLLAFPKTSKEQWRGSGTWATIRRGRRTGREVRFFPLDGSSPWIERPSQGALA